MKSILKELAEEIMTEKKVFFNNQNAVLCLAQRDDLKDEEKVGLISKESVFNKLLLTAKEKQLKVEDYREGSSMNHSWIIGNENEAELFLYIKPL